MQVLGATFQRRDHCTPCQLYRPIGAILFLPFQTARTISLVCRGEQPETNTCPPGYSSLAADALALVSLDFPTFIEIENLTSNFAHILTVVISPSSTVFLPHYSLVQSTPCNLPPHAISISESFSSSAALSPLLPISPPHGPNHSPMWSHSLLLTYQLNFMPNPWL